MLFRIFQMFSSKHVPPFLFIYFFLQRACNTHSQIPPDATASQLSFCPLSVFLSRESDRRDSSCVPTTPLQSLPAVQPPNELPSDQVLTEHMDLVRGIGHMVQTRPCQHSAGVRVWAEKAMIDISRTALMCFARVSSLSVLIDLFFCECSRLE